MEIESDGKLSVRRPLIPYKTDGVNFGKVILPHDTTEQYIKVIHAPFAKMQTPFIWLFRKISGEGVGSVIARYYNNEDTIMEIKDGSNWLSRIRDQDIFNSKQMGNQTVFRASEDALYIQANGGLLKITSSIDGATAEIELQLEVVDSYTVDASDLSELGVNLYDDNPFLIKNNITGLNNLVRGLLPYVALDNKKDSEEFNGTTYQYATDPKSDDQIVLKALVQASVDVIKNEIKNLFTANGDSKYDWESTFKDPKATPTSTVIFTKGGTSTINKSPWIVLSEFSPEWIWRSTNVGGNLEPDTTTNIVYRKVMPIIATFIDQEGGAALLERYRPNGSTGTLDLDKLRPLLKINMTPIPDSMKYDLDTASKPVKPSKDQQSNWFTRGDILALPVGVSDAKTYRLDLQYTTNTIPTKTVYKSISDSTIPLGKPAAASSEPIPGIMFGNPKSEHWGDWFNNYEQQNKFAMSTKDWTKEIKDALDPKATKVLALSSWQRPGDMPGFHKMTITFTHEQDITGMKLGFLNPVGSKTLSEGVLTKDFHVHDGASGGRDSTARDWADQLRIIGGTYK